MLLNLTFLNTLFYCFTKVFTKKQQELADLKLQIEELKGQGLSNRAIAREINCSERKSSPFKYWNINKEKFFARQN